MNGIEEVFRTLLAQNLEDFVQLRDFAIVFLERCECLALSYR